MIRFVKGLNREVALDAARNVFAIVGVFGWMATLTTMQPWMAVPCLTGTCLVWYAFYLRYEL